MCLRGEVGPMSFRQPFVAGHSSVGWRATAAIVSVALLLLLSAPARALSFDPLLDVRIGEALAEGDMPLALALVDEAIEETDDTRIEADLLARRGELLYVAGRYEEAAEAQIRLAELIEARDEPGSPALVPVLEQAATAFEASGNPVAAVEALDRLIDVLVALGQQQRAQEYAFRAYEIARAGDGPEYTRAEEIADRAWDRLSRTERRVFNVDPEEGFATVRIYYATDRQRSGEDEPAIFYGGLRGEMEMGVAEVSIPPQHLPGAIERPSIWSFEFRENPARHVVLHSVTPKEPDEFFSTMQSHLGETGSDTAFVFVHGFNVTFEAAAHRTAQMAYDMNFDGLPILYSWPSRGSVLSYIADTAVVNHSGRHLTRFLEDVVRSSGASRIHLVAHSMGNRALTDALELYALRHQDAGPHFDQILFTAPDLDAGLFVAMVETIRPMANRLTLYASDADWALAVSRRLHGDAPRAGEGGQHILRTPMIDSIDMTSIGEDMLMHSYYANNPSALTDILSLFWRDAAPSVRCGMVDGDGAWQYAPDQCDGNALLSTISILRRANISTFDEARTFLNRYVIPTTAAPEERSRLLSALDRLFGQ